MTAKDCSDLNEESPVFRFGKDDEDVDYIEAINSSEARFRASAIGIDRPLRLGQLRPVKIGHLALSAFFDDESIRTHDNRAVRLHLDNGMVFYWGGQKW